VAKLLSPCHGKNKNKKLPLRGKIKIKKLN
jgi:hypothetical protein